MTKPLKAFGFTQAFAFELRLRYFCLNPFIHIDRISTNFEPDDPTDDHRR